ncbi:MAG: exodeoxyribonuclease V subunit gamma [Candidatus Polarisedimenticolaceae bacterium]|nr:exodeoxyribonuclease V subunit gamma [Candidatus Polarisedimenticolaceae bacterium]
MLKLYQSNQLELLVDQLADLLPLTHGSPFQPESIVVPHLGMRRWLTLQLAQRLGICANVEFPLPARLIWDLFRAVDVDLPEQSSFTPDILRWRILGLLPQLQQDSRFASINAYQQHVGELECYQLASRIAETFDQYLVYRPDWLTAWEAGQSKVKGDAWQAELWRQLITDAAGGPHWIHLLQQFEQMLSEARLDELPKQLVLFGISTLSPAFLQLINRLAEQIDVHLFLLNPSQCYWTEIVSPPEEARQQAAADGLELYLEVGNPILASLGRQGRDFFASIFALDPGAETQFVEPTGGGQLAALQREILNLEATSDGQADGSIRIHDCHSAMREVEVLRDQLLDIFQHNPDLTPEDVLVMSPDIDSYAPAIEALFSESTPYLPYSIVGRQQLQSDPAVRTFFALLQTAQGRMGASEVVALLEFVPLRHRFELTDGMLPQITQWIEQSAIRWGRDGKALGQLGLPERGQNSWQEGLQRLLLGYAMSDDTSQLFSGILPAGDVEGGDATILGGLCEFLQRLFELSDLLKRPRSIEAWCDTLHQQMDCFFKLDEQADELATIRAALERVQQQVKVAKFEQPVGIELLTAHLKEVVESEAGGGQGGRGIIFGSPATLRCLPAAVVCMIGMNDGSFPRQQHPLGFDLMAAWPRLGDRSRRADDRYLFLECLLSARHTLYISYTGRDQRDNKPLPPSELVNELLDYLGRDELLVQHPLQPFNRGYFAPESALFSYSKQMCEAGQVTRKTGLEIAPFFSEILPEPEVQWRDVSLNQLLSFFSSPARYLLRQRLGIRLDEGEGLLQEREPFELDYLEAISLKEQMLQRHERQSLYEVVSASGRLPQGEPGQAIFDSHWSEVENFKQRMDALALPLDAAKQVIEIDLQCAHLRLNGQLNGVTEQGLFQAVPHPLWANQHLSFWLNHLLLNALKPPGIALVSRCLDSDNLYQLGPVDEAEGYLQPLLQCYWQGLSRPLPLLPKSSLVYAEQIALGKSEEQALAKANAKWHSGYNYEGECEKPYFKLAFRGQEPLDSEFQTLSEQLLLPYLQHRELL